MNEIICLGQHISFDEKSVLVCEDLYQLLPVRVKPVPNRYLPAQS